MLKLADIQTLCKKAHAKGDWSPSTHLHQPLLSAPALGADIVVHSSTKYLNGHSDMVGDRSQR